MSTSTMHPVDPLAGPSALQDTIKPQFHQVPISAENYIKQALGVRLDTDTQICRLALSPAGCPLGPLLCPLRHTDPAPTNFSSTAAANSAAAANAAAASTNPRERERLSTVCKHWLRGLCKKSDACEFLHEYNLRRMPECRWFAEYGYCSSGDECLYLHPKERKIECPDYKRGFCKLGPSCPRKHVRRVACQAYLTGFCPAGPDCPRGHPKPDFPPPSAYLPPPAPIRDFPPPQSYGGGRFGQGPNDYDRQGGGGMNGGPNQSYQSNYGGGYQGGGGGYRDQQYSGGGGGGGYQGSGGGNQPRRNLDDVLCFKCGAKGHYANHCRNRNVPGYRGGVERRHGGLAVATEED